MKLAIFLIFCAVCCLDAAVILHDEDNPTLLDDGPWKYNVTVDQLMRRETLPDGDQIQMVKEQLDCLGPNEIALSIELISPVIKWKAIYLHPHAKPKYSKPMVSIQDNESAMTAMFPRSMLDFNDVILWKKGRIVPTERQMYKISDAAEEMTGGYKYTLKWIADK